MVTKRLRVVYFIVANTASSEENLLLNHYLKIGYRPSLALFLDGINEACVTNDYEREMRILFDRAQQGYAWDVGGPARDLLTCSQGGRRNQLRTIHARTLAERAALCRLYDIECRTLVQPIAGVHGRRDGFDATFFDGYGATLRKLFEHLESNWRATGAIFLSDVLDHYNRHAFIDEMHYSADASRVIAEAIAARLAGAGNQ